MWVRALRWASDFAEDWAGPIGLGLAAAALVWIVWYFTKPACTATAAANGFCNPGIVARYITVEVLLQLGGAALAIGALKGGYDRYMMRRMLNEEREARHQAEQALEAERRRVDETIQQANEARDAALQMVAEMVNEFREERRQAAEERRQAAEERRQADEERQRDAATQQALLDTIVRLTQQSNGHTDNGDD